MTSLIAIVFAAALWSEGVPRLMPPRVFGATPGREFRHAFPVCGSRSNLVFSVASGTLPDGAALDAAKGVLTGRVTRTGEHAFRIRAANVFGTVEMPFKLVIGEHALCLTPPMGWTSWNAFGNAIDRNLISASARALVDRGLPLRAG